MFFLAAIFWVLVTWLMFAFLAAIPVWALWNWLMPSIFGMEQLISIADFRTTRALELVLWISAQDQFQKFLVLILMTKPVEDALENAMCPSSS